MIKSRKKRRIRRKMKIAKQVRGVEARPRVFVFRSNTKYYVGVADDVAQVVLASMMSEGKGKDAAEKLGKKFGKKLAELKIKEVVFDRSGYKYHGNIKVLADAIRDQKIVF